MTVDLKTSEYLDMLSLFENITIFDLFWGGI